MMQEVKNSLQVKEDEILQARKKTWEGGGEIRVELQANAELTLESSTEHEKNLVDTPLDQIIEEGEAIFDRESFSKLESCQGTLNDKVLKEIQGLLDLWNLNPRGPDGRKILSDKLFGNPRKGGD